MVHFTLLFTLLQLKNVCYTLHNDSSVSVLIICAYQCLIQVLNFIFIKCFEAEIKTPFSSIKTYATSRVFIHVLHNESDVLLAFINTMLEYCHALVIV